MEQSKHPTKEQIRAYLVHRRTEHKPPPAISEIRKQLGWEDTPLKQIHTAKKRRRANP